MNTEELQESYGSYGYGYGGEIAYSPDGEAQAMKPKPQTAFEMVKEFHETYGQPVGDEVKMLDEDRAEFRWNLIHEEYLEVAEALDNHDLPNLAKELADLIYVVNGWAVEMGVDLDAVVAEVHRSNLSKLGADGKPIYREDGKVLKGEFYKEPNIEKVLFPEN